MVSIWALVKHWPPGVSPSHFGRSRSGLKLQAIGFWMSPSFGRDSVAFHFTWVKDEAAVRPVMAAVEERLARFEPRPHWGKLFSVDAATVAASYPKLAEFRRLVQRYDPHGKFRNPFVDPYLG